MFGLRGSWSFTLYWILCVPGAPKWSPLCLFAVIIGGKWELSEQTGLSHVTLICPCLATLTMSPGQKLQVGGSKSESETDFCKICE